MELRYLFLVPACLAFAVIFMVVEKLGRYVAADVLKGIASACFVALGFFGALGTPDVEFARLALLGLLLGAVADVLLNLRYVFEGGRGRLAFLAGILVFLAGHVCYALACAPFCPQLPVACVAGLVLTAALMYWILGRVEATLVFKVFGVFYIGAVVVLNCIALVALIAAPCLHWAFFCAGTLLFLVSDVILILNTFGPKARLGMRVANLTLYYVGQLLIALSLQLAI